MGLLKENRVKKQKVKRIILYLLLTTSTLEVINTKLDGFRDIYKAIAS